MSSKTKKKTEKKVEKKVEKREKTLAELSKLSTEKKKGEKKGERKVEKKEKVIRKEKSASQKKRDEKESLEINNVELKEILKRKKEDESPLTNRIKMINMLGVEGKNKRFKKVLILLPKFNPDWYKYFKNSPVKAKQNEIKLFAKAIIGDSVDLTMEIGSDKDKEIFNNYNMINILYYYQYLFDIDKSKLFKDKEFVNWIKNVYIKYAKVHYDLDIEDKFDYSKTKKRITPVDVEKKSSSEKKKGEKGNDDCEEGKIRSSISGRCVSITGKLGKEELERRKKGEGKRKKKDEKSKNISSKTTSKTTSKITKSSSKKKKGDDDCEEGKIRSSISGRCVSITGKLGKEELERRKKTKKTSGKKGKK